MWRSKRYIFLSIVLIIALIELGFLRDYLFKGINYFIQKEYYNLEQEFENGLYSYFEGLGLSQLISLKWIMTLVFMGLNYLLSIFILKSLFKETKTLIKLISIGYILLFILSATFYILGEISGNADLGYTLARRFMGVLQSPVPLMVVVAVHMLFGSTSKKKFT